MSELSDRHMDMSSRRAQSQALPWIWAREGRRVKRYEWMELTLNGELYLPTSGRRRNRPTPHVVASASSRDSLLSVCILTDSPRETLARSHWHGTASFLRHV
jgi:hypothetical protein